MKVLTLLDIMEMFNAKDAIQLLNSFKKLADSIDLQKSYRPEIDPEYLRLVGELLDEYGERAKSAGLKVTNGLVRSLSVAMILAPPADLSQKLRELQDVYEIEIASHKFLYLRDENTDYLFKKNAFGESVANAFPSISYDLEEASTCYGLARNTACVFHLMRVLEVLFECLQSELGVTEKYTTWGNYLSAIANANRTKNPDKNSEAFLYIADIEAQLWAIKNAWRDNMIHSVAAKYTEEESRTIFQAVESVMKKAAQKLKEAP